MQRPTSLTLQLLSLLAMLFFLGACGYDFPDTEPAQTPSAKQKVGKKSSAFGSFCGKSSDCLPTQYCRFTQCPVSWNYIGTAPKPQVGYCTNKPLYCLSLNLDGSSTTTQPVCGCNGVTYASSCLAQKAGQSYTSGACTSNQTTLLAPKATSSYTLCSKASDCGKSQYCKKSSCASSLGICTDKPANCYFTSKAPVTGCNNVNYYNACYAALAGVSVYKEQWVKRVEDNLCSGDVFRFGSINYPRFIYIAPAPGEYGHYAATGFIPPAGQTPWKVSKISYDLMNQTLPGAPLHGHPVTSGCNAGLAHKVLLFVVPANSPPVASPVILRTIQVAQTSAQPVSTMSNKRTFTHSFASLTLNAGEKLMVAVEMSGTGADNMVCLGSCYNELNVPQEYWSFATQAPFNWAPSSAWGGSKDAFRIKIYTKY